MLILLITLASYLAIPLSPCLLATVHQTISTPQTFPNLPVSQSPELPVSRQYAPPSEVTAIDKPNDAGSAIQLRWTLSPDDASIEGYTILRKASEDTAYTKIGSTISGVTTFEDEDVQDSVQYQYIVAAIGNGEMYRSEPSALITSYPQLFHTGRINVLLCIVAFTLTLAYLVIKARTGKDLFIRKIAGLAAVDEAVGRATEMGKPILYVPGLGDIDWTATIASMNILGEVAKKIALYDSALIVPNRWSVTYTVSKEVVKEAFISEGSPEKFKEEYVRYVTEAQFGFAAAITGIMMREKPATNFFIGRFWAESLIMAETGAQTGSFQIAGTDSVLQLPFFVTACDYTLIGEELYAASAYLSREPLLLGSLKAQDYGKLVVLLILFVFTVISFLGINLLPLLGVQ